MSLNRISEAKGGGGLPKQFGGRVVSMGTTGSITVYYGQAN
jgi:hypothetical protein